MDSDAEKHRQQAGCQVPLPTVFYGPEIPLSAGSGNRVQITELQYVFDDEERILGAEKRFFPCHQGNGD